MTTAFWPLQQALYDRLAAHSWPRYGGEAPRGATLPYVVIGDITDSAFDTQTSSGAETIKKLDLFAPRLDTLHQGMAEAVALLDGSELDLSAHGQVNTMLAYDGGLTKKDPDSTADKPIWHGQQRYRALTQSL